MMAKRKSNFVVKQQSKTTFSVRSLSELHVSSWTVYVINTDMAVSLEDFTAFFQDKGKSVKRGENHHKSGHVESCRYQLNAFIVRLRL